LSDCEVEGVLMFDVGGEERESSVVVVVVVVVVVENVGAVAPISVMIPAATVVHP
jgi:hypothetical protein